MHLSTNSTENQERFMEFKKISISLLLCIVLFVGTASLYTGEAFADTSTETKQPILYKKQIVGYYNSKGEIEFVPNSSGDINYQALTSMLTNLNGPTIIIPSGANMFINGPLKPRSNTTIIATGATLTFKSKTNAIFTEPNLNVQNLTIVGGTWRSIDANGRTGSLFVFAHANNIVIDGVDVNANYIGHAIEVIACSNVTIKNSVVNAIGKNPAKCLEEQIQIDVATKKTAPKIAEYGKQYVQGQTCHNIYILNNYVKGARAVGVNWSPSEKGKFRKKFHSNVVISGNYLVGTTSEALAFFNCVGGSIDNNTIITNAKRKQNNRSYTIGVHVEIFGKAPKSMAKSNLYITNNVIKGNRHGIYFKAYFNKKETKCISKIGKVYVTGNQIYTKKGKKKGIGQTKKSVKKLVKSGNKLYKW